MEKGKVRRAVLSTVICSAIMWYDYILVGSLTVTIGELFFHLMIAISPYSAVSVFTLWDFACAHLVLASSVHR
ncbi:hypothetical protein [Anaplasma platys]|uniref:hypothetical protein n=1 Tax=Anaplasma platys TaxID=949 RepID=UPI001F3E2286|nr:hypothetical protein [Anaplasma platys]